MVHRDEDTSIKYDPSEIAPLTWLAEHHDVDLDHFRRWADHGRKNNFPRPVEHIGSVGFFVRSDVDRWITLWRMTGKGARGE